MVSWRLIVSSRALHYIGDLPNIINGEGQEMQLSTPKHRFSCDKSLRINSVDDFNALVAASSLEIEVMEGKLFGSPLSLDEQVDLYDPRSGRTFYLGRPSHYYS
jgi:hypothetical protein